MNMNLLGNWVDGLQQGGYYSFLRQDAVNASHLSAEAVKKSLQRLSKRKRIAKVTDSFYVIVPTEYVNAGAPPVSWFIHHLMETKEQPYYVGLLSAASLHGASHHQPQEFQVVTNAPLRPLKIARQRIHFFTKRSIEKTPMIEIKTPTGMIHVSTPEATALDLIRFSKSTGHLAHAATVIKELAEQMHGDNLLQTASRSAEVPTVQRLGYLLEAVGAESLAALLATWLHNRPSRAIALRPGHPTTNVARNRRWNILVNEAIEAET